MESTRINMKNLMVELNERILNVSMFEGLLKFVQKAGSTTNYNVEKVEDSAFSIVNVNLKPSNKPTSGFPITKFTISVSNSYAGGVPREREVMVDVYFENEKHSLLGYGKGFTSTGYYILPVGYLDILSIFCVITKVLDDAGC